MKHEHHVAAKAAALTIGVVYIFCWLALWIAPQLSMSIARSWFHGIDLNKIAVPVSLDPGSLLIGLITSVVGTWLVVYVYNYLYMLISKRWK